MGKESEENCLLELINAELADNQVPLAPMRAEKIIKEKIAVPQNPVGVLVEAGT